MSCSVFKKTEIANEELFSINGESTLADEFLYVYEKNNFNNDRIFSEKDVDEYFDLFVNFKLKVAEAKSVGIDTTQAFTNEFQTYKKQLLKPFLSETKEREKLVIGAYERMKYEIDASHILVTIGPDSPPEDTTKAYQKILEVYEKAKSGKDFEELALQYSEDPSAKTNKGRLGYFTAFQMVYQFEDAAYSTPVDSVSEIIRSSFGYHIVNVHDKRPFSGKVKVSHIMLSNPTNSKDDTALRNKIFEIHEQIVGGADWNELCIKYSEDQRTKNKGGTLPFIGLRQINDLAFEQAAFGLQKPGEISDPVRSKFGWHILKLEEKIGLESFEDIKEDLEQRISKDDRAMSSKQAVITRLKSLHDYSEHSLIRTKIVQVSDSSLLEGKWRLLDGNFSDHDTVFSIADTAYMANQVIEEITAQQKPRKDLSPTQYMNTLIDAYIESCLLKYEENQLIAGNREFRMLLNEYYEGILLFEIMNQRVWGKAVEDTIGLKQFFETNHNSYYWGKRANAVIIRTADKNTFEMVMNNIDKDSYDVIEVEIDKTDQNEVLKDILLDSLIENFNNLEKSTIKLVSSNKTSDSPQYIKIKNYLRDVGIPEESIVESSKANNNKIQVIL